MCWYCSYAGEIRRLARAALSAGVMQRQICLQSSVSTWDLPLHSTDADTYVPLRQGMYNEARRRPEEAAAWYNRILEDGSADQASPVCMTLSASNIHREIIFQIQRVHL